MTTNVLARNNRTLHWEIQVSDGQVFGEKCRDSIGGFSNLMDRLEVRLGGRLRRSGDSILTWLVTGTDLTVTIEKVEKL